MPDCLHNGHSMNIDGFLQPKTNCDFARRWLNTAIKTSLKTGTCISAISYSLSYSAFREQFSQEKKCYLVTILLSYGVVLYPNTFLRK